MRTKKPKKPSRSPERDVEKFIAAILDQPDEARAVWRLKGKGTCELRSSSEPGRWMLIFFTSRENAAAAWEQLEPHVGGDFEPAPIPFDSFFGNWMFGMHEDQLLVGLSHGPEVCVVEIEPLLLFNRIGTALFLKGIDGGDLDNLPTPPPVPDGIASLLVDVCRQKPARSRGLEGALEPVSPVRPAKVSGAKKCRKILSCISLDQVSELLEFIGRRLKKNGCEHKLVESRAWAKKNGVEPMRLDFQLRELGQRCDCEVTYNLAEQLGLEGKGNGTFETQVPIPVATQNCGLAVADFLKTGRPQVFVTKGDSAPVLVSFDGAGNYTTTTITTALSGHLTCVAADMNRDGYPDVVAIGFQVGQHAVFLNDRAGGFVEHLFTGPVCDGMLTTGDFDGDGRIDVALPSASSLTIFLNK